MECQFETLYSGEEGYVVRCKKCSHYQVAFISTMLTLNEDEFNGFCLQVNFQLEKFNQSEIAENAKCVAICTPSKHIQILLTIKEVYQLQQMLEHADNESCALSMLSLFAQ